MPLYVKWTQFLSRHYEYVRLSKEITAGCKTDEEKVLAVLKWTREHLKDVPPGMPICDDHILNIIIRGYAVPEQFQEVFVTLCSYSGAPAFYEKVYSRSREKKHIFSFVKLSGKWRIFDAYSGLYFRTKGNDIAAVEDIMSDKSLIGAPGLDNIMLEGIPCKEFYLNLGPVAQPVTSRAQRQMPLNRVLYEIRKAFNVEKTDEDGS